jgi:hypothetical protein
VDRECLAVASGKIPDHTGSANVQTIRFVPLAEVGVESLDYFVGERHQIPLQLNAGVVSEQICKLGIVYGPETKWKQGWRRM